MCVGCAGVLVERGRCDAERLCDDGVARSGNNGVVVYVVNNVSGVAALQSRTGINRVAGIDVVAECLHAKSSRRQEGANVCILELVVGVHVPSALDGEITEAEVVASGGGMGCGIEGGRMFVAVRMKNEVAATMAIEQEPSEAAGFERPPAGKALGHVVGDFTFIPVLDEHARDRR